jgi:hypothetical protein
MKTAYLILAHTDPKQFGRLVRALAQGPATDFYVHIDQKVDQAPFEAEAAEAEKNSTSKVQFCQKREFIQWAGFSIVRAEVNLLEEALQTHHDHYILLSGLDYPLWSNAKINALLAENPQKNHIVGYNLTQGGIKQQLNRVQCYHLLRDIPVKERRIRRLISGPMRILMEHLPIHKPPFLTIAGKRHDVFHGAQWWALTEPCAQFVLQEYHTRPEWKAYFKTSYAPDELAIQTIVFNSPFQETAIFVEKEEYAELASITPLHFLTYDKRIFVYDEHDFETLVASNKPFARKLCSGVSEKLIQMLDARRAVA